MLFTIKKNTNSTWDVIPNDGLFSGKVVATAECVDLTSVIVKADRVIGNIKAIWGASVNPEVDVYADVETVRGLCLGKPFKGYVEHPVEWNTTGVYDSTSGRILRSCRRLLLLGDHVYRGYHAVF